MTESENRKQRVFRVISDVLSIPVEMVDEHSSPDSIDSWDSLKQLNLTLTIEEEFGVSFSDQQIIEMQNVELILAVLDEVMGSE
jgi:acyl carrier protein